MYETSKDVQGDRIQRIADNLRPRGQLLVEAIMCIMAKDSVY